MSSVYIGFLGVTMGLALAAGLAALAQGKVVERALEGVARQPEARGPITTIMVIGLALIESLVIYSLLISYIVHSDLTKFHNQDIAAQQGLVEFTETGELMIRSGSDTATMENQR